MLGWLHDVIFEGNQDFPMTEKSFCFAVARVGGLLTFVSEQLDLAIVFLP